MEASQPSCQAEKHSSQQSEGNVGQSKSIEPSSSTSPHGQLEPSSPPKTLSKLRAKPTLGERLSQPGMHFNGQIMYTRSHFKCTFVVNLIKECTMKTLKMNIYM